MYSLTGFLTTIILLGAVQGFIAGGLLYFSAHNRRANRFLARILFLIALACFNHFCNHVDWFGSPVVRFLGVVIPTIIFMPVGPLIWFYTRASLDPQFKLTRKRRLHFLPVIIDFVPSLTAIIYLVGVLTLVFRNNPEPWGIFIDEYNTYSDIPRWLSVTTYTWLSFRLVRKKKAEENINRWLKQFTTVLLVFQVIWLAHLIPYLIPKYSNRLLETVDWYPLYLPMVVIVYWLGIKGYMISYKTGLSAKKTNTVTNSLTNAEIDNVVERLQKTMKEEKLYLNPELNLAIISKHTSLQQKIISAVLNQHIQKSFNAFVNEYRVEAFKERIRQAGMENLTMAGIAAECGFNSQATFQRTFKEITGMSPSEYKKSVLKSGFEQPNFFNDPSKH
jgi:AraC-like DNA-binding protein